MVDYRDCAGRWRWETCDSKGEADDVLSRKIREAKQAAGISCADPNITVSEYFAEWIEKVRLTSTPRTSETYADYARLHILAELGEIKLRKLHRARIKTWLVGKLNVGYPRGTIKLLIAILRAMLNEVLEDGLLLSNPALRIGRTLKVAGREGKKARNEPKAFTREQLAAFLASANPRWCPYFLLLPRTGSRLGESLALEVPDVHFRDQVIVVSKACSKGSVDLPKDGESREVDMSSQLADVLKWMLAERCEKYFAMGVPMPTLLFPNENGTVMNPDHILRAIERTLRKANLAMHLTVHCFRHTFASQLLQMGVSPAYVQRQMGHTSTAMTVDTYGKWLPTGNREAVDKLDEVKPPSASMAG